MMIFALDPRIRLAFAFAFNGRRASYDPITGTVNPDFELPESAYFNMYKMFPKEVELDSILETKRLTNVDVEARVSDRYGILYDAELIEENLIELNK